MNKQSAEMNQKIMDLQNQVTSFTNNEKKLKLEIVSLTGHKERLEN